MFVIFFMPPLSQRIVQSIDPSFHLSVESIGCSETLEMVGRWFAGVEDDYSGEVGDVVFYEEGCGGFC